MHCIDRATTKYPHQVTSAVSKPAMRSTSKAKVGQSALAAATAKVHDTEMESRGEGKRQEGVESPVFHNDMNIYL
jgi:hypothetical protein